VPSLLAFDFAGGLRLRVEAGAGWRRQLLAEYGPSRVDDDQRADVSMVLASAILPSRDDVGSSDRHKSVGWRVRLGSPGDTPLRAEITSTGWPPAMARSLAQGFVLEPVLSLAASRRDIVLVSAAAIVGRDGLTLLLGRSRAGKTTLAARSLAAGADVLGDDQVFVDASGRCWAFPRRLRLYPDLRRTAPEAFAVLPARQRRKLTLRGAVAALTRDYVRPSLAVDPQSMGGRWLPGPLAIARVLLLERNATADDIRVARGPASDAAATVGELLALQRARFASIAGPAWTSALAEAADRELAILEQAFDPIGVDVVSMPAGWGPRRSIDALTALLDRRSNGGGPVPG
jgi:hypothetical protein